MGKYTSGDFEKSFACGPGERRPESKKKMKESCLDGRNLGYHLGYHVGFESGYEKGYAEGSTLGYNNGFLAALTLEEEGKPLISGKGPNNRICQILKKMIIGGSLRIFLDGAAAIEAENLLRLLEVEATVLDRAKHS